MTKLQQVRIADIQIGKRHRKDMGNLTGLARSIQEIGLLQPIGVKPDLDPASTADANAVVGAAQFYTAQDNGLDRPWRGRIWLNPPYAAELIGLFAAKLVRHVQTGDVSSAIVLVNNATETAWFHELVGAASAICFPRGRIKFWAPGGRIAQPFQGQALIYLGNEADAFQNAFAQFGWCARL